MATYSLTAAVVSGYRVRLSATVTSPTVGATMTLSRGSEVVAGASGIPAVSTVLNDGFVPLGRPVQYTLTTSDGGSATSTTVTVTAAADVLSDPAAGLWASCRVAEYGEQDLTNSGTSLRIMGSSEVVIFHDVETLPSLSLVVLTETTSADSSLSALCASGGPLLLRWAEDNGEPDWTLQPISGRRRLRYAPHSPVVRHSWPTMQAVSRDLTTPAKGDTYADLKDYLGASATYGTMKATWSTYLAAKQADLRAG